MPTVLLEGGLQGSFFLTTWGRVRGVLQRQRGRAVRLFVCERALVRGRAEQGPSRAVVWLLLVQLSLMQS